MLKLLKPLTKGLDIRTPDNLSACGNAEPCMKAHTERDKSSPVASEAEGDKGVTLEEMSPEKKVIIGSHSRGSHNLITHCPKDPNCDLCRITESTRPRCKTKSRNRKSDARSEKNRDFITADSKVLNEESE